jgi:hypothetical protein
MGFLKSTGRIQNCVYILTLYTVDIKKYFGQEKYQRENVMRKLHNTMQNGGVEYRAG